MPAAFAAAGATGDGVLELRDVDASKVTIRGTKGVIWGQLDKGTSGGDRPQSRRQPGCARQRRDEDDRASDPTASPPTPARTSTFASPAASISSRIIGTGIDLTAVGVGRAWLAGDPDALDDGDYAIDGGKWQPVPLVKKSVPSASNRRRSRVHNVSAQAPNILVVEDESSIASFVSLYLKNAGYGVRTASTGTEALSQVAAQMPGLIVLDLMLPDIDGLEVCKRIRQTSDVPILMLTARDEDVDKIIGLEVGADDYLTKPFNPRELVARVKSILRRATPERRERETEQITHGDLRVDAGRREVRVGEEEIQLAPKEFDLLWELLDHRGLVLTRDQLLERVWGYTFAGDTRTVDVHVRQLRRKLGDASPIVTVWGVGYKVSPAKDARKETTKT